MKNAGIWLEIFEPSWLAAGSARLEPKSKKLGSARLAKFRLVTMSSSDYHNRNFKSTIFIKRNKIELLLHLMC